MTKIFLFLLVVFSSHAFAEAFLDFNQYMHSNEVDLHPQEDLNKLLQKYGYDSHERNWVAITKRFNGLSDKDLQEQKNIQKIYLPPKLSYQEYLNSKNQHTVKIKKECHPVSKGNFSKSSGHIEYIAAISSRKIPVKKGDRLDLIIQADEYSYGSIARGVKLTKEANGLTSNVIEKDQYIYLPFCGTPKKLAEAKAAPVDVTPEKIPARRQTIARPVAIKPAVINEKRIWKYSVGILGGGIGIKRGSSELQTKFFKLNGKARYKMSSNYTFIGSISLVKFFNATYSGSNEKANPSSVYPEFGLDVVRNFKFWNLALSYDMINFFIASDQAANVKLDPNQVHRLSLKPSLPLTPSFTLFGEAGLLKSFNKQQINGYDMTLGGIYHFGKDRRYHVFVSGYMNVMDTTESSQNDKSRAWTLGFNYDL